MATEAASPVNVQSEPASRQREEMDHLKGLFLASLTHEVRTPLSGVIGMADLLLETDLDEEQREYVNAARLCAESLFEILNATLQYAALEAGRFSLDESEFSLKEMLDAVLGENLPKAQAKGLRLFSRLEAGLPETMLGDAPQVRGMLGHLISNAIKFTHSGEVELRAFVDRGAPDGPSMVLEVRDTGIGIAADKLDTIFESFHQVEGGLSRGYPGLGLGLALVRKLAALMHGRIDVASQVGMGSTFTVHIPLRRPLEVVPERTFNAHDRAKPMILAVEDNPVGLTVLKHGLERRHARVDGVMSGREALEAASRLRYDLVLMDLQMPEMDGLTATAAMRKLPGYDTVPILALTANCSDEIRHMCRQAGMQAFIAKPVVPAELWAVVSKFLKSSS
jgi:CheY-like chemotaxis protein/nitrogen-specific signal transduction histidine kinase